MSDWIPTLAGTATAAVLAAAGGWLEGRKSLGRRARCVCGHVLADHDWKDGECQADVCRRLYATNGQDCGWTWVDCACRGYVGKPPKGLVRLRNGEFVPADGKS